MRTAMKLLLAALVAFPLACSKGQKVAQGKVLSYDADKRLLLVEDEAPPNQQLKLDTSLAEFGSKPAAGHVVRVVYRDTDGRLFAGRVMNLTVQQKDKKK